MNQLKKYLTLLFLLIALFTIIFINLSCEDNPVAPGEPPPGRRDYVWKEYRMKVEGDFLQLNNVWASSPTNAWGSAGVTSAIYVSVVHFDGSILKHNPIEPPGPNPNYVWGLDSNNVWLATSENDIWHFNGQDWYKQQDLNVDGYDRVIIQSLWGDSIENLYGVGGAENYSTGDYIGVIIKYNNGVWEFLDIPEFRVGFKSIRKDPLTNHLFISATNFDNGFLDKLYHFDGKVFYETYSKFDSGIALALLGEDLVFLNNQVIYKYNYSNRTLEKFIDLTGSSLWGGIGGRNINDFFCVAADGIGHYNGTNFETIYKSDLIPTPPMVLDNDVFFGATDYNTLETVLIHAKLKKE